MRPKCVILLMNLFACHSHFLKYFFPWYRTGNRYFILKKAHLSNESFRYWELNTIPNWLVYRKRQTTSTLPALLANRIRQKKPGATNTSLSITGSSVVLISTMQL